MDAARRVATNEILERIGHAHLAVMTNIATRYNLSLAEMIMDHLILLDDVRSQVKAIKIAISEAATAEIST